MAESRKSQVQSPEVGTGVPPDGRDGNARDSVTLIRETVPKRAARDHVPEREPARDTVRVARWTRWVGPTVRVLFGLIWAVNSYFKWQPSFLHGLPDVMSEGAKGQPGWLTPWFNLVATLTSFHPTVWAYGIAIIETAIGVALIVGFARKLTYVGGALWSLAIWSTAEGFGRTPDGVATDIGTAIIYAVVFVALLAFDARSNGTRPLSLDALVERRMPTWRAVAEIRG